MFRRLVFTLITAVSLTCLCGVYTVAMRPIVVIPDIPTMPIETVDSAVPELPAENVRVAETHLPFAKWTSSSQHTLLVEHAFVYTNDFFQDEQNKKVIHFEPFAMVWVLPHKEHEKEEAICVVSDAAQLEVANFDERTRSIGRVVAARLDGKVRINGPQNFAIAGRNFVFEESTLLLRTFSPVKFRFQKNEGSATRMDMKLVAADGVPSVDRPHVSGIESVHLIAGPNPSDPGNPDVKLRIQLPNGNETIPMTVICKDELEYQFATNTATLSHDVRAWRGQGDTQEGLQCDRMTINFKPREGKVKTTPSGEPDAAATGKHADFQMVETDLEFSSFKAESLNPDVSPVLVISRPRDIVGRMSELTYEVGSRSLFMSSANSSKYVAMQMKSSSLMAPEIQAKIGEKSLESLLCLGDGELSFVDDETEQTTFRARWQRHLSFQPDAQTGLNVIELSEQANFAQPDQKRGLGAELIRVWLARNAMQFDLGTTQDSKTKSSPPPPEPKRLLAQGDVRLISPEMKIERSNELEIRFDDDPVATSLRSTSKPPLSDNQTVKLTKAHGRKTFATVNAATNGGPVGGRTASMGFASVPAESDRSLGPAINIPFDAPTSKPKRGPAKPTESIVVSADRIFARMLKAVGSNEPKPREVHADGKVTVTQMKQGQPQISLRGTQVRIEMESDDQGRIQLVGQPALIQDKRFQIEGKDIRLDQFENNARVEGAGELKLPIPENASIQGLDGATSGMLRVRWDYNMEFDGAEALFNGRVEAKLGNGTMHCEKMHVQLAERMSFQIKGGEVNPELKSIKCDEKVSFDYSSYLERRLDNVYRGEVGEFQLDYQAGHVIAQGPGEVRHWHRKMTEGSSFSRHEDSNQANRPIPTEVSEWEYTRIEFEGKLNGYFDGLKNRQSNRQRVTVEDRVEVVHGPVQHPTERIHPDNLPSKGGTLRCNQLQVVNYSQTDRSQKGYQEMIGLGNAELEGQYDNHVFTASADEISYDGSKTVFTLRARGRHEARLSGIGHGRQNGRLIKFNPERKLVEIDGATSGQISQ